MTAEVEKCSIIVVGRERLSTTDRCLDELIQNSPEADEILLVLGGVPQKLKSRWTKKYSGKVHFIFKDQFIMPPVARNMGLREAKNRLAVTMDNDVYVRPGWLKALIDCQSETGAAAISPLILESPTKIHAAGNVLYITYKNGKAYGNKELCFYGSSVWDSSNLKRQPTDYGEAHCQLVVRQITLETGAFDEKMQEVIEVDSSLTWKKHDYEVWFEPASIVNFDLPDRITNPIDIPFFIWRWDMRRILEGYNHFEKKWNLDITECGRFQDFLIDYNNKVGWFSRRWPSTFVVQLELLFNRARLLFGKVLMAPAILWRRYKAKQLGYYDWKLPSL